MTKSNLKILPAYRMYQAPEGGGEKPLRTSYLKDPLDVSTGRGGGGAPAHAHCQGQNMSGHYLSGQKLSGQNVSVLSKEFIAHGVTAHKGSGGCPVVNTLDPSRQSPRHGGSMPKPTGYTTARQFKVRRGFS